MTLGQTFWALRWRARWFLLWLLRAYRFFLSPWIGNQCRFWPSCSHYASEAIERHGSIAGTYFATKRLLRCHPWCSGGYDPVPEKSPWPELLNAKARRADSSKR